MYNYSFFANFKKPGDVICNYRRDGLKKVCTFVCALSQNYVYLSNNHLLQNSIISSKMGLFVLNNICSSKHVVSLIN